MQWLNKLVFETITGLLLLSLLNAVSKKAGNDCYVSLVGGPLFCTVIYCPLIEYVENPI
jgi:hypothetical protein